MRVAIVGAGIVGLAHAWAAVRRGHSVAVFEKSPVAAGASIRNFGMVWPIGQPHGEPYRVAIVSRDSWIELAESAGVWANRCGSLHLAYQDDELAVLREFAAAAGDLGIACQWLGPADVMRRSGAANPAGLLGGIYSPTEICVNPRRAIPQIARWLADSLGVDFHFSTHITRADSTSLRSADGRGWDFDRVVVCGGSEAAMLFPDLIGESGIKLCKLQMLRTVTQPAGWLLGPHLAGGLTLRHYRSFEVCPSLEHYKKRIADEKPYLDRYGIHVMASQDDGGNVILGDSHEYDDSIEPFDKEQIDRWILEELRTILCLPDWSIESRWHGIYAKYPAGMIYSGDPSAGVHVRTGTGGAGMTLSFGLADGDWKRWDGQ